MMNQGTAMAIVKNIEKAPYTDNEKAVAIYEVMGMATHNSITKADMLNVIKWLWNKFYTMEQGENDTPITNYDRIRNMSVQEMAEFFDENNDLCCFCTRRDEAECKDEIDCKHHIKQWLESEVETE